MIDWKYALIVGPSWAILFGGSIWLEYKLFWAASAALRSVLTWC